MKIQNIDGFIEKIRQAHTPDELMTTNSNPDTFAETMDRQYAQALMTQLEQLINRGDFYLIKQEHLDALAWYRNDQCQMMLKEANND